MLCLNNDKIIGKTILWLDGSQIKVRTKLTSELTIETIEGSPIHNDFQHLNQFSSASQLDSLSFETEYQNWLNKIQIYYNHPFSNEISMVLMNLNQRDVNKLKALQKVISGQNEKIKEDDFAIHKKLDKLIELKNLNLMSFVFLDSTFKKTNLHECMKTLNVVDLWFTACPPCLKDHVKMLTIIPHLNTAQIAFIGLSVDEDYDKWKQYLAKKKLPWQQFIENRDEVSLISESIPGYPFYLIVDKSGNIIDYFQKYEQLYQYLKQTGLLFTK